jgi:hypothetical protein
MIPKAGFVIEDRYGDLATAASSTQHRAMRGWRLRVACLWRPQVIARLAVLLSAPLWLNAATPTTVTLSSSANPSLFGQPVTLTAALSSSAATGKVTFYDGATVLGTETLAGGQAGLSTILLGPDRRSLKAYYGGDATYASSTSPPIAQTVNTVPGTGFPTYVDYTVGEAPYLIAVADFNGDGKADLAVATDGYGHGGSGLSILLGNGDGTFQPAVTYAAADSLNSIAVGDFNGDGKPDVVVTSYVNLGVSVFLGNGDGTFQPPVTYPDINGPFSVAVGDFNGDGEPDLAVSNYFGNVVSVMLGNGDGTFQSAVNFAAGAAGYSVAVGDFNGDGKADLAVANGNSYNLSVLLGNGDGTFRPAVNYDSGSPGYGLIFVVTGDFNGDGKADLAATVGDGTLAVFLGNGDGTFQAAVDFGGSVSGRALSVGDFNGDGKTDIATASPNVYIFLGNGDGTFQAASSWMAGVGSAYGVAVGDFRGNGAADFAVADSAAAKVSIMLSASPLAGTTTALTSSLNPSSYGQSVTLTATVSPSSLAGTVTFNDGSTSLGAAGLSEGVATLTLTTLSPGSHALTATYENDPASTSPVLTQIVRNLTTTTLTSSAIVASFGQSVTLTARVSPSQATGTVTFEDGSTILGTGSLNSGAATFTLSALAPGSHSLTAIYGGDTDDSGSASPALPEIVNGTVTASIALTSSQSPSQYGQSVTLTAAVSPAAATGSVTFYDGVTVLGAKRLVNGQAAISSILLASGARSLRAYYSGDSTYAANTSTALTQTVATVPQYGLQTVGHYLDGSSGNSVAVGDFNGDGKADLIVAGTFLNVLLGNGDGTFQAAASSPTGGAGSVAVGDFNGDGNTDVAVASYNGAVAVLLGNGDGTFQPPVNYIEEGNGPWFIAVGDFNNDGRADLVVANQNAGVVSVLLGNGDGTLQPAVDYAVSSGSYSVAIGDFNRDGNADLAVANGYSNNVSVLLGNGDGTFQPAVNYPTSHGLTSVAVGDFNGDGKADLAVADYAGLDVSILEGNGDGTFQPAVPYGIGNGPTALAVGDFNGDGKPDLLTTSVLLGGSVGELLGKGDGTFGRAVNYYPAGVDSPYGVAVGDFNGDGRPDVAVTDATYNNVTILLGAPAFSAAGFLDQPGEPTLTFDGSTNFPDAGGFLIGVPAVAQASNGDTYVVGLDDAGGVHLNTFSFTNQVWNGWQYSGGILDTTSGLTAAVDPNGVLWFTGRDIGNRFWMNSWNGTSFGGWILLDQGIFASDSIPQIAIPSDGSIYVIGKDVGGRVWSNSYIPATRMFTGWVDRQGIITGQPSVTAGQDGRVYMGVRSSVATHSPIYVMQLPASNAATATTWVSGGGLLDTDPSIASVGGTVYVAALADGQTVYLNTFVESTQMFGGWTFTNGILNDITVADQGGNVYIAGRDSSDRIYWYSVTGSSWSLAGGAGISFTVLSGGK